MMRNQSPWRLALGAAAAVGALTMGTSAAKALAFNDNDVIIALTKNGYDQLFDFGNSLAVGTTKTFTLPSPQFPAGASGALSEGAVANVLAVPNPGLQETDTVFGPVPVAQLLFSTTTANPAAALTDTEISNASQFLEATPGSGWLGNTISHYTGFITSTTNSVLTPTTLNGSYSNAGTGPGNGGQNTIAGSLPFTTVATIGPGGSLLLNVWFASQGYVSQGGSIPTIINKQAELQFSETGGILSVMVVPEPGTLLLLGAGLLGLVSLGSRRKA